MASNTIFVIYLLAVIGLVHCGDSHDHDDDDGSSGGLTMGQIAAIAIGGCVVVALLIIGIIAIIVKCNKKPKASVKPTSEGTTATPIESVSSKMPLYDDAPPKYSLRDQGPSRDVFLPPYSESYPTKHAV